VAEQVFQGLVVEALHLGLHRHHLIAVFGFLLQGAGVGQGCVIGCAQGGELAGAVAPSGLLLLPCRLGGEALGVGLGTAAFVAFIARATNPIYTATQYALFSSLAAVPRTLINSGAGYLVEQMGWFGFFLLCAALAVPGMLLLFRVAPWRNQIA